MSPARTTPSSFESFVSLIERKSSLQKKAIRAFFATQDALFFERAEQFCQKFDTVIESHGLTREFVVDSYLKMCADMLREQIKFRRTGAYSCRRAADAYDAVYSSEREMASYMYALALSIFLWPNHYRMFDFFLARSRELPTIERYLEIGPGHGVFLAQSMRAFPGAAFHAIDISPVSIRIAAALVERFVGDTTCRFERRDVMEAVGDPAGRFDFIVMCEVLEHLDDPNTMLRRLREMLTPSGRLFVTTCANAPAIDHVYLYHDVAHIRRELRQSGFEIQVDLALPVGDYPESDWDRHKVEINYAAMLRRDGQ